MPLVSHTIGNDPGGNRATSSIREILKTFEAPVSELIARSMITSSFNGEDRFDWTPQDGLRVSIPDNYTFVKFGRAPASEIRNRLFASPKVRGNWHQSAVQPQPLPERSLAWWFAQLVHYGLPITCDRAHAKESLKLAIVQDRLAVPLRLRELETSLKRQYVVAPQIRPGMVEADESPLPSNRIMAWPAFQQASRQPNNPSQIRLQANIPLRKAPASASHARAALDRTSKSFLRDEDDTSSSDLSVGPETERPLKAGHLFTPDDNKIAKRAEHPGIREHEAREPAKIEAAKTAKLKSKTSKDTIAQKTRDYKNKRESVARPEKEDDSEPRHDNGSHSTSQENTGMQDAQDVRGAQDVEDDQDDSGSVVFYTPMQFLKKRRLSGEHTDDESVIFSGYSHKPGSSKIKHEPTSSTKKPQSEAKNVKSKARKLAKDATEVVQAPTKSPQAKHPIIDISSDQDSDNDHGKRQHKHVKPPKSHKKQARGDTVLEELSTQARFKVQDNTGCGITKMSGALHSDDEAAMKIAAAIERSYDPDSVPSLREQLSSIPAYLKVAMRHESPELSQGFSALPFASKTSSRTEGHMPRRSRSASVAPVSPKRSRRSMLEIEAGAETSDAKRPRLSTGHAEPASVRQNIAKTTPPVSGSGSTLVSKKSKHKTPSKSKSKRRHELSGREVRTA